MKLREEKFGKNGEREQMKSHEDQERTRLKPKLNGKRRWRRTTEMARINGDEQHRWRESMATNNREWRELSSTITKITRGKFGNENE